MNDHSSPTQGSVKVSMLQSTIEKAGIGTYLDEETRPKLDRVAAALSALKAASVLAAEGPPP